MKKISVRMRSMILLFAIVFAFCAITGCAKREANLKSTPEPSATVPMDDEDASFTLPPTYEPDITPDFSEDKPKATNFTVKDKDGNDVELASLFGKPIVLNFWATWCSPCCEELPFFQEAYNKYGNEVNFLFIANPDGYNETVESIKEFMLDEGYDFPVYFDTDYSAYDAYSITSIPQTYYINSEGSIAAVSTGGIPSFELLEGRISLILPQ